MRISDLKDLEPKNVDWRAVGQRVRPYRKKHYESKREFAKACDLTKGVIDTLEVGLSRKSVNCLWKLKTELDISLNWLLNGIGSSTRRDPERLIPETIRVQTGQGIPHDRQTSETLNGEYGEDIMEFIAAIDAYKRINDVTCPRWSEVMRIIQNLGYRKFAVPKISPRRVRNG